MTGIKTFGSPAMKTLSCVAWALFLFVSSIVLNDVFLPQGRCPGCINISVWGLILHLVAILAFPVHLVVLATALSMSLARGDKRWIRSNLVLLLCSLSLVGFVGYTWLEEQRERERARIESAKYSNSRALAYKLIGYFQAWYTTAVRVTPQTSGSELIVSNDFTTYCEEMPECKALIRIKNGVIIDTRDRPILFAADINMDGWINGSGLDHQYRLPDAAAEKERVAILIDPDRSDERYSAYRPKYEAIPFFRDSYR
jgi:hypothetical protein